MAKVSMLRILNVVPLVVGVVVIVKNRAFGDAGVRSTRNTFRREPGRYAHAGGRAIAIVAGAMMVTLSVLRLLGRHPFGV
jgi:hypothetical protein